MNTCLVALQGSEKEDSIKGEQSTKVAFQGE